jgi:hypothetical protein
VLRSLMIGRLSLLFAAMTTYSDFLTRCTDIGDNAFDAALVDGTKALCTDVQGDPALL